MVVQSSRMQRTRTIAAAIKKYLLRTSLLHSRYLFSASVYLALFLSFVLSRYYYSRLCTCVRSLAHSFVRSFIHSIIYSSIHLFILIHLLTYSFSFSYVHIAHMFSLSLYRKSYLIFLILHHTLHLSTYLHLVITIIIVIIVIVSLYIYMYSIENHYCFLSFL